MPKFSAASLAQLETCDMRLQNLMHQVIRDIDFSVNEGHRNKAKQDAAVANKVSKTPWPTSNHNSFPSRAVDIVPYPIDWSEKESAHMRFALLAGYVLCTAKRLGIKIRWGGDWNRNQDTRDESFVDLPHFELDEP